MRRFRFHLAAVLFWFCAFAAHADGFRASYTPEAQPGGPPQGACNGCSCSGGNTPGFQGASVADPIWTKDGSLHLSYTDLSIGAVMPINVVRRYDSHSTYDSAVGYGWAFFHDQRLFEYPDGSIVIRTGCGRRDKFVFSGGAYVTPQGGSQGQLTEKGDGTYQFRYRDGNSDLYDASGRLTARVARSGARQDFIYDARGKRIPYLGSVNMGACRFLNVLLGASGASALGDQWISSAIPVATSARRPRCISAARCSAVGGAIVRRISSETPA